MFILIQKYANESSFIEEEWERIENYEKRSLLMNLNNAC
jgi:hypothetical protein